MLRWLGVVMLLSFAVPNPATGPCDCDGCTECTSSGCRVGYANCSQCGLGTYCADVGYPCSQGAPYCGTLTRLQCNDGMSDCGERGQCRVRDSETQSICKGTQYSGSQWTCCQG